MRENIEIEILLMEQLLNEVPSNAHGIVSHMIDHAPRGPGYYW